MVTIRSGLLSIPLLTVLISPGSGFASSELQPAAVTHHELFVQLDPERHGLLAEDRITLQVSTGSQPLRFQLAPTLLLDRVTLVSNEARKDDSAFDLPFEIVHGNDPQAPQQVTIPAAAVTAGTMMITARYHGFINDPPKEPRHLRFVTPSETAGYIGPEGIYLSGESQWYLDQPGSLSIYRIQVALPDGWTAVTQGKPQRTAPCPAERCGTTGFQLEDWSPTPPTEALTLVANRFVVNTRDWRANSGQSVQLATYLFPDEAALADEYLDATARYLEAYIPLLGPYPFETFAVVENFFASGLGMPSFTLLGSGVIKRHYVQPYALGHEIVHSWIGNSVFNRVDKGNWVEGLTTYLANYYWHELVGDRAQAHEQRRLMLRGYNLHVPPDRDYPVGQFTHKYDERDNAIGYQKAAMVFHLLRQELGDDRFWAMVKRLTKDLRGHRAEWRDIERLASEVNGHDLRWFFAQWVERSGAPNLALQSATAHAGPPNDSSRFHLQVTIIQSGEPFLVPVPLRIQMDGGREQRVTQRLSQASETLSIGLSAKPLSIDLDPDTMVLRRIPRQALPPALNHFVTDRHRLVVNMAPATQPFTDVVNRLETQEQQKPVAERILSVLSGVDGLSSQEGSVLILAGPEARTAIQPLVNVHCGDRVQLREHGLTLAGQSYEGAGVATLASCHRRDHPGSVLTLLYAVTPQAATNVGRLLFFYGWHSAVVFKDGAVIARNEWPVPTDRMEVVVDERHAMY